MAYWEKHHEAYKKLTSQESHHVDHNVLAVCHDAWRLFHLAQFLELAPIDVHELFQADIHILWRWLDAFPADQHGKVWLEAYEGAYRE